MAMLACSLCYTLCLSNQALSSVTLESGFTCIETGFRNSSIRLVYDFPGIGEFAVWLLYCSI